MGTSDITMKSRDQVIALTKPKKEEKSPPKRGLYAEDLRNPKDGLNERMDIFDDEDFKRMLHDEPNKLWDIVINSIDDH